MWRHRRLPMLIQAILLCGRKSPFMMVIHAFQTSGFQTQRMTPLALLASSSHRLMFVSTYRKNQLSQRRLANAPANSQPETQQRLPSPSGAEPSSAAAKKPSTPDMIPGNFNDLAVEKIYYLPSSFDNLLSVFSAEDIHKKQLTHTNLTVPTALMLLDPDLYPSQSQARKACRRGAIAILRRDQYSGSNVSSFENATMALVGDRVYPGDALARQVRVGPGYYAQTQHAKASPFLSVVYEDDHFAIVYKPAGYTVFRNYKTKGPSVQAVLPWSLLPPEKGTLDVLRSPLAVHRLDKPTSGLLLAAKTKPAMVDLSRQFHDRVIQKTYMAVVNGIVPPPSKDDWDSSLVQVSAADACFQLGVDVDPQDTSLPWYRIDAPLVDPRTRVTRNATTVFRVTQQVPSLHASDDHLSLVELKPKTGRYHQLRRHLAFVCRRALVGDSKYDGNTPEAIKFRSQGLFLSSTRVKLEHPFYNTKRGRAEWNRAREHHLDSGMGGESFGRCSVFEENGTVMVTAEVDLPAKFTRLLERANDRFFKFSGDANGYESSDLDEDDIGDD